MTRDEAIAEDALGRIYGDYDWVSAGVREHVRESVLAALRAAPPAPAPELVALVQQVQRAQREVERLNLGDDGKLKPHPAASREYLAALVDLLAWTPTAPVEPSARPETEPNDGPPKREGDERLMLNAYGRQCHAAGFAAGYERKKAEIAETAAPTPAPTALVTSTRALLSIIQNDLTAIRLLVSDRDTHSDQCNGDEDAHCDCGSLRPRDVVDSLLEQVAAALSSPVGETPARPDAVEGQCPNCGERDGAHGEWCRR